MAELTVLAVNVAAAVPGWFILRSIGFTAGGAWTLGPAYLTGVAGVLFVQVVVTPLGIAPTQLIVVLIALGLTLAGVWFGRARQNQPDLRRVAVPRLLQGLAWIALLLIGALILFNLVGSQSSTGVGFDAWAQWVPKAEVLAHRGLFAGTLWGSSAYTYVNPDYPLALPLLDADQLTFAHFPYGSAELSLLAVSSWCMLAAFAASLLALFRHRSGLFLVPFVICFVAAPGVDLQSRLAMADIPLAIYISLGVVLLAEWLEHRQGWQLILGSLFLAVGANFKDEGSAIAVLVSALVVVIELVRRNRTPVLRASVGLGVVLLAIAPWRIWLAAHHIHGVIALHSALNPAYLLPRSTRAWHALNSLLTALARPGEFLLLPAIGLALIVVVLTRRDRLAWRASYFLAVMVIYLGAVVWAEWASPLPINLYLPQSDRFVTTIAAVVLVAMMSISQRLLPELLGTTVAADES